MTSEVIDVDVLKGFSPLDGLKRDNLAALARKIQMRELSPGQVLFKEGGRGLGRQLASLDSWSKRWAREISGN